LIWEKESLEADGGKGLANGKLKMENGKWAMENEMRRCFCVFHPRFSGLFIFSFDF
jgi:hypothetical protein